MLCPIPNLDAIALVLDCLDVETGPFSKGTFVTFRTRLIEQQLDRHLLERPVELGAVTGAFCAC